MSWASGRRAQAGSSGDQLRATGRPLASVSAAGSRGRSGCLQRCSGRAVPSPKCPMHSDALPTTSAAEPEAAGGRGAGSGGSRPLTRCLVTGPRPTFLFLRGCAPKSLSGDHRPPRRAKDARSTRDRPSPRAACQPNLKPGQAGRTRGANLLEDGRDGQRVDGQ